MFHLFHHFSVYSSCLFTHLFNTGNAAFIPSGWGRGSGDWPLKGALISDLSRSLDLPCFAYLSATRWGGDKVKHPDKNIQLLKHVSLATEIGTYMEKYHDISRISHGSCPFQEQFLMLIRPLVQHSRSSLNIQLEHIHWHPHWAMENHHAINR